MDNGNGGLSASDIALMSGGGGFGGFGNGGWESIIFIIAILALLGGGFGNGFGGGSGGFGGGNGNYDFPWLMAGQQGINTNTNSGFRDQMINDNITSVRDGVANLATQLCGCCGDIQMSLANGFAGVNSNLCSGFNGVNMSIYGAQNAISQQLYNNEIASLNRSFDAQTANTAGLSNLSAQLAQCCCENRAATQDVKYTIATEACQTRANATQNTQAILDKLCQLELDGYKAQIEAKNDQIAQLRQEALYARGQASQIDQTARILAGQNAEVDALYDRLNNCPIGTVPVYGRQPIFTCNNNNNGCNCGCNC